MIGSLAQIITDYSYLQTIDLLIHTITINMVSIHLTFTLYKQ